MVFFHLPCVVFICFRQNLQRRRKSMSSKYEIGRKSSTQVEFSLSYAYILMSSYCVSKLFHTNRSQTMSLISSIYIQVF